MIANYSELGWHISFIIVNSSHKYGYLSDLHLIINSTMRLGMILLLWFAFFSCKKAEKSGPDKAFKYYWVMWHGHEYKKVDTNFVFIERAQLKDTSRLSYFNKSGSSTYYIIKNRDSSFVVDNPRDSLLHLNDSIVFIRLFHDTAIFLGKDTFKVKEFIMDEYIQDGGSIMYYEPSLGFYAGHSDTWPGLRILQSSDTSMNRKIRKLVLSTVPKFFIRVNLDK